MSPNSYLRLTGALSAVVVALALGIPSSAQAVTQPVNPPIRVGLTHTQHSADNWKPTTAVSRARAVATRSTSMQNQHIMGWGAGNLQPAPGVYDWRSLDQRVDMMRKSGDTPVLTLCCSPDWMKGGKAHTTDWSALEVAPKEHHFDEFAAMSAEVAKRYPDVKYYQVWNELKGFWDPTRNRWDIEAYTRMYNKVYTALKAVDPDIQVGGPYVPMDSYSQPSAASHPSSLRGPWGVVDQRALDAVTYWLEHKAGADFITVDGWNITRDKGMVTTEAKANLKFAAITSWLDQRTSLPIWWGEIYAETRTHSSYADVYRSQVMVDAIAKIQSAGGDVVLIWQPEGHQDFATAALWTPTDRADGGRELPLANHLYWAQRTWQRNYDRARAAAVAN